MMNVMMNVMMKVVSGWVTELALSSKPTTAPELEAENVSILPLGDERSKLDSSLVADERSHGVL